MPNPQLDKISPMGDLKYPIGDIIPNWVYSSISPLILLFSFAAWVPLYFPVGAKVWSKPALSLIQENQKHSKFVKDWPGLCIFCILYIHNLLLSQFSF